MKVNPNPGQHGWIVKQLFSKVGAYGITSPEALQSEEPAAVALDKHKEKEVVLTLGADHTAQTRFDFGGNGAPLHLAVANGFPAETYQSMVSNFLPDFAVFAWLPRALWEPAPNTQTAPSWMQMAEDILAGFEREGHQNVLGVGHSMGAVATFLAASLQPERFRGVVLLDPVIFPPATLFLVRVIGALGGAKRMPLSKSARRRKARFSSKEEAFLYWQGKRLFSDWPEETLQAYTDGLLVEDGDEWRLRWSPQWEAHYYETLFTKSWPFLRKLPKELPVLFLRGTRTDTFLPPAVKRLKKELPHMDYAEVDGGHLFPQTNPEATSQLILQWIDQHGLVGS